MTELITPEPRHGSVIDGRIKHLAVTQIQKFNPAEEGCPLKWWYSTVQGRKEPTRPWHETGDSVDTQWTHYLSTNENVLGQVARAGLDFFPEPGADLLTQWGLNDQPRPKKEDGRFKNYFPPEESKVLAAGIPLIGFTDLLDGRESYLVPVGASEEEAYGDKVERHSELSVVECTDLKTTKNFTYAKRPSELRKSTQMRGYGMLVNAIQPSAELIRLSQVYLLTEGSPKAIKRSTLVSMSELRDSWRNEVEPIAEQMKSVAATKNERDVQGNLQACKSFGGCSCRDFCWLYKSTNSLTRLKSKMGLLGSRKSASSNGAAPGQQVVSNGAAQQPPMPQVFQPQQFQQQPPQQPPAQTSGYIQQLEQLPQNAPQGHIWAKDANQGDPYFVNGMLTMYLASTGGRQSFLPIVNGQTGGTPVHVDYMLPIVPAPLTLKPQPQTAPPQVVRDVEAPPAPAPLAAQTPNFAPGATQVTAGAPQGLQPPSFAPGAAQTPSSATPAAEPKKRARRTNAQIAIDNAAAAAQAAGQPIPFSAAPVVQPSGGVFKLNINTIPNEPFTDLAGYVAEAAQALQEQFGVIDIRAAPGDSPLAFAKWRGLLAQVAKQDPPPPGTYVAFTRGNELTEVVAEALVPLVAPGFLQRGI